MTPPTKVTPIPLPATKITAPQPTVMAYTTPTPVTKHAAPTPPNTKYTALTVGNILQARPLMTSSTNLLVSNKTMPRPVMMNIPNVQLEKMLAMSHPVMHLNTGEGSQIHSSTVTMSVPAQSILSTALINPKHNESPSQWQPLSSSTAYGNLAST